MVDLFSCRLTPCQSHRLGHDPAYPTRRAAEEGSLFNPPTFLLENLGHFLPGKFVSNRYSPPAIFILPYIFWVTRAVGWATAHPTHLEPRPA